MQGSRNDPSKLSTNPAAIRARLRRKAEKRKVNRELIEEEMLGLPTYKPLDEWDIEELARGRVRDSLGGFRGTRPMWLDTIPTEEIKRRLRDKTYTALACHVDSAIALVGDLLVNDDIDEYGRPIVDARTRLDAAKFVVEHVIGKARVRVDVDTTSPIGQLLASVIVNPDGTDDTTGLTIDGEWEEVDDDE